MPLYLANFLQGFVLWYTIEKLFMRHIGFDDAGIGIMVAAYSAIMLLVETPSGILADRWSRRGMLVVASVVLAIASWVGGISQGIPMYMVSAGCWGVFFALYSGTYDSMVYDTLLETKGHATDYERYYGRMKVADSLALVVGSILGGVLATQWGLRSPYFLTIPFALVSIVPLVLFKEPELHKKHAAALLTHHVRDTFRAVTQKGQVVYVVSALVLLSATSYALFEFAQLWMIALAMPVAAFGLANGLLLGTIGVGGVLTSWLKLHRQRAMQMTLLCMGMAGIGLAVWRSAVPVVALQLVLSAGATALVVVFTGMLHDALPSQVRAGASSAVSTLTRVIIIPLALLFGLVSRTQDVFHAAWIFVVLLGVTFLVATKIHMTPKAVATADKSDVEEYQK
jgi:predicted MFS family arabinose efflux permease